MMKPIRGVLTAFLFCMVVFSMGYGVARAATPEPACSVSGLTITPKEATANSLWYFTVIVTGNIGPVGVHVLEYDHGTSVDVPLNRMDDIEQVNETTWLESFYVSAGIRLAVENPNKWLFSLNYLPGLLGHDVKSGATPNVDEIFKITPIIPPGIVVKNPGFFISGPLLTIHDSHYDNPNLYGGIDAGLDYADRDFLTGYLAYDSAQGLYSGTGVKLPAPVSSVRWDGSSPDDQDNPDDGTANSSYVFRVMYINHDGMPPLPYLSEAGSYYALGIDYGGAFSALGGRTTIPCGLQGEDWSGSTGVVLYLGTQGGNYYAFPMYPESVAKPTADDFINGVVYKYVVQPQLWNGYCSLPLGKYNYFFGCSDDWVRLKNGSIPMGYQGSLLDPKPYAPGNENLLYYMPYYYVGDCACSWGTILNTNCYVDRPTYVPGVAPAADNVGDTYPLPANEHPVVTLGLFGGPTPDDDPAQWYFYQTLGRTYRPWPGTVEPYYRVVDPTTGLPTTGGKISTPYNFKIVYQDTAGPNGTGLAPEDQAGGDISLWINNADYDDSNYTRYTLARVTDSALGNDITQGVLYKTPAPIFLSAGPHSYYFTASDGKKLTRFPVLGVSSGGNKDVRYFQGPYINHAPVLSNPTPAVDPAVGVAGRNFAFSVTYADADNQRPYQAHMIIQYDDDPTHLETVSMTKADVTNSDYVHGVKYIFNSANLAHKLQPGTRKFHFEFIDDWGGLTQPEDRVQGELVRFPAAAEISGPYITVNHRPVLYSGQVVSPDGTSNSATVWNYKVTYKSQDNQSPTYVGVYIGALQSDGSIKWDNGHKMTDSDPNNTVYTDGKQYTFSTTLTGSTPANNYYYAFVASDGISVAQYDPINSPSADTVWETDVAGGSPTYGERLTPTDSSKKHFVASHFPLVGALNVEGSGDTNQQNPETLMPLYQYPLAYDDKGNKLSFNVDDVSGDYTIAYPTGSISLTNETSNYIDLQYVYGESGPTSVGLSTPPSLSTPKVSPDPGTSAQTYTFSVIYTDVDGPSGQGPTGSGYIRVRVDGKPYDLASVALGTPNYKIGAKYQTTMTLSPGVHKYYFEASTGSGYAMYDINGNHSSTYPITGITAMTGPYVIDAPTLTNVYVNPNPLSTEKPDHITPSQPVTYSVMYKDSNNQAPDTNPVVYIDDPIGQNGRVDETPHDGIVTTVGQTTLQDSSQSWTTDQFKGMPIQITSGAAAGNAYTVAANSANTLTLISANLTGDGIQTGDTFSIGKIQLTKVNPAATDYVNGVSYAFVLPGLGTGTHSSHFYSVTHKVVKNDGTTVSYPLRTSELSGPKVVNDVPSGTIAPVLDQDTCTPSSGTALTPFNFSVRYRDINGNAPAVRDGLFGYIHIVIDGQPFDMVPPASPAFDTGAVYTYPGTGGAGMTLLPGTHKVHFECSDGWNFVRQPAGVAEDSVFVNHKPTLANAVVAPLSGNAARQFAYSVVYTDLDGTAPQSLQLMIGDKDTNSAPTIVDPSNYTLTNNGASISTGRTYTFTLKSNYFVGQLGQHTFKVQATDGTEWADPTPVIEEPNVHTSSAPTLTDAVTPVNPPIGFDTDSYTYGVIYASADGDTPAFVKVDIDGGDSNGGTTLNMTPVAGSGSDYTTGVQYVATKSGLAAGTHKFSFSASNGVTVVTLPADSNQAESGPTVSVRQKPTITLTCPTTGSLGQMVNITGQITPYVPTNVVVTLTDPSGTASTPAVTEQADGSFKASWTPSVTGRWTCQATTKQFDPYLAGSSDTKPVQVAGPSTTVKGLDMISFPMVMRMTYPSGVLDATTKDFAIAKWLASSQTYKIYSVITGINSDYDFPPMATGEGYWIKTTDSKTIAPDGSSTLNTDFSITLQPGWNMIGDPFNSEVEWSSVKVKYNNGAAVALSSDQASAWVRSYAWAYDKTIGSYVVVDPTRAGAQRTIVPWHGYWIKALTACQLIIPVPTATASKSSTVASKSTSVSSLSDCRWLVKLKAANGSLKDENCCFGVSQANGDHMEKPGALQNFVEIHFTDDGKGSYASDVRPMSDDNSEWNFVVSTDVAGDVTLTWDGIDPSAGVRFSLTDETTGKSVVMANSGSYTFHAGDGITSRSFHVVVANN